MVSYLIYTPLTPSLPQHVKFYGLNSAQYTPQNSIIQWCYGTITNLLSLLTILIEFLSRAHAKGLTSQIDFKFGTTISHFLSDRAANMAVKGLMSSDVRLPYLLWTHDL